MLKKLLIGATILSYGTMAMAQTLHFGMVWRAVEQKDEVTLGTISKTYGTVDVENRRGQTPLCHAIDEEDYESYVLLLKYGANRSHPCVQRLSQEQRAEFNENLRDYFEDKGGVSASTLLWEAGALIGGAALIGFATGGKGGSGDNDSEGTQNGGGNSNRGDGVGLPDKGEKLTADDFKTDAYKNSGFLGNVGAAEAYARFYTGDKNSKDSAGHIQTVYTNLKEVKVAVIDSGVAENPVLKDKLVSGFNYDYGPCRNRTTNCWKHTIYPGDGRTPVAALLDGNGQVIKYVAMTQSEYDKWKQGYADDYTWDMAQTTPNRGKDDWHGTFVTSIIAADRQGIAMHGIAQNAKIIPVKYDLMSNLDDPLISAQKAGAKVINMSLGTPADEINASVFAPNADGNYDMVNLTMGLEYLRDSVNGAMHLAQEGTTAWVIAAGNEGQKQPNIQSGIGLLEDLDASLELQDGSVKTFKEAFGNLKDLTVVSVAVDQNNQIADFSNRCGVAKDYCIAAPGVDIVGYTDASTTAYKGDGTSFSAPVVSGALAFLMGAYPNLTAAQAIDLIFETATDLGDKGVDTVYGHGLLNLDAATAPQGTMTVATADSVNGKSVNLGETHLKMPRIMKGIVHQMPVKFAAFDKYQRSFMMPTSSIVSVNESDGKNFQNALHRFMKFDSVKTMGNEDTPMQFSFSTATNTDSELGVGSMDVSWHLNNTSVRFYYMEDGAYGMGDYVDRTAVNPFMAMDNAYGFENAYRLNDKYAFSFGLASGDNALFKTNEDDMEDADRLSVFQGGATYTPNDKVSFGLVSGMMAEENAFMGLHGNGGFDMENTRTYYAGITAQLKPIQNLTLTGAYYYGMTPSTRLNDFMQTGKLHSDAFSFDARYHFDDTQYVGMVLSSPLRVRSGYTDLTLPTGRDYYSDTVYNETHRLKMAPEAREWDTGVYGQFNLAENIRAKMQGLVRFNPEHQADVKPDYQVMFGLNWLFN